MRVAPNAQLINSFSIKADNDVSKEPDLAFDGVNYMVVWSDGDYGGHSKVQAARVTPEGIVLDTGVVFGIAAYCEYHPSISFDGNRYLAVWYNYSQPPFGVYGRFISTACQPDGREIVVRELSQNSMLEPDIAFCNNTYCVVWNEPSVTNDNDVYAQIISLTGQPIGNAIPVATGTTYQYHPRVCACDSNYLIVWNQECLMFGQWISSDGQLIGNNFCISDTVSVTRDYPDMAFSDYNCLVAWHQFNNGQYDIFGNIDTPVSRFEDIDRSISPEKNLSTIFSGNVRLPEEAKWQVFDITGRKVEQTELSPGIYLLFKNGQIYQKIIKIR